MVELSPEVIKASDTYFGSINHGVLADERVRVEINDGRNFMLASPERFDAVLSDSIHPAYAGNGSLYSLEYFRLIRDRLEPGGIASMWLPTYFLTPDNFGGILEAFAEVFPHVAVWYEPSTLNAFTIVTGKVEDSGLGPGTAGTSLLAPPDSRRSGLPGHHRSSGSSGDVAGDGEGSGSVAGGDTSSHGRSTSCGV